MATKVLIPNDEQIEKIKKALTRDKQCNFNALEYCLKQVIVNRDVTFTLVDGEELIVPAREAWRHIVDWSQGEGELPVGDHKSYVNIRSRATRLLNYLQTNISGKTAEAAGSYRLILEQAKRPAQLPTGQNTPIPEANLQKVFDLRRKQIELLESKFLKPLASKLDQSKFLARLPDTETRALALQMIAAANTNFRYPPNPEKGYENYTAEKVHQLLLHNPGIRDTNSVMRLVYSKSAGQDFTELSRIINETIQEVYKGDESAYQQDMSSLRSLSSLSPSLDSIPYLVRNVGVYGDQSETEALIRAIRKTVIASAMGEHVDGRYLLQSALKSAGFPELAIDHFKKLEPYIEEMQIKQRHLLLGTDLSDHDSRLLGTSGLAAELGVDLTIPWVKEKDLNQITERAISPVAEEYYQKNPTQKTPLSLQQAFDFEYAKGSKANHQKLAELTSLMSKHADFQLYHKSVDGNLGYQLQELWGKGLGNYLAVKEPIDRFSEKMWGGIESIDDIVRGPQRALANWWEKTQEDHPWLNPGALIANKWVEYQTGIALKIHAWALKAATSNAWFRSFAGHISDFTEGFIKHDAKWGGAGAFFVQRKIGNTLDWATRFASKGKFATFTKLRFSVADKMWSGFTRLAPGLSAKMAASGLGKVIVGIIGGEMTMGVSVALQIGWEVIKYGFSTIKKLLTDSKFRERFINRIPLMIGAAITASTLFISGIPAAILAGVGLAGAAVLGLLQAAVLSLAPIFGLAALISFSAVAFVAILWFNIISPTFHLDAGTSLQQIAANILCDDDSSTTGESSTETTTQPKGSSVASCAECLYKYLTACYGAGTTLTGEVVTSKFGCLLATAIAPDVAETIKTEASKEGWLQCVGFARAAARCAGGDLPPSGTGVAAGYIRNVIPGYKFVQGAQWCQPGDFGIADGLVGHICVVKYNNNGTITCIDANYIGDGMVSNNSPFPTGMLAGCLKRI